MAILDRPLFQRRPTRDQLRGYGLPAFANGGIVGMGPGQSLAMTGGTRYAGVPRAKTAEELLREDYGSLGYKLAGEKALAAREQESIAQEKMLLDQAKIDKERAEKEKADREAIIDSLVDKAASGDAKLANMASDAMQQNGIK